jgi:hypothetical protein
MFVSNRLDLLVLFHQGKRTERKLGRCHKNEERVISVFHFFFDKKVEQSGLVLFGAMPKRTEKETLLYCQRTGEWADLNSRSGENEFNPTIV